MIENLRLDDSVILSSSNTHKPSLPLTNIYDTSSRSNHLSPTSSVAYDATTAPEGWCTSTAATCIDQSRLRTDNTTLFTNNTSTSYSALRNVYSYGNYYNWYSATAGRGTRSVSSGNTTGDICPAGWHLPTGNTSGEFNSLNTALSGTDTSTTASNNLRSHPNNFVYSGGVTGSSVDGRRSFAYYWSSSAYNLIGAHELYFDSSIVLPGTHSSNKYGGRAVRCVAGT